MTREDAKAYIIRHCNPDYPKGKTEWEQAINIAVDALEQPVKTIHKRVVVSKFAALNEHFLRAIDLETAHEFGENLLESGSIKRDVYDQSEMDFLTGDCLKDASANEDDLTIMYTLRVV